MHPGPAKRGGAGSLEDYGARVAASSGGGAASTSRCHACRVVLVSAYSKRARLCVECMRSEELEVEGATVRFCQRCHKGAQRAGLR